MDQLKEIDVTFKQELRFFSHCKFSIQTRAKYCSQLQISEERDATFLHFESQF